MAHVWKTLLAIFSKFFLIPVVLFLWSLSSASSAAKPPEIVDFRPTTFEAKANSEFFYSIGDQLKYSNQINSDAPTLLRGQIVESLVSPNGQLIAVVANGKLQIVSSTGSIKRELVSVDSVWKKRKPFGVQFFRDDSFQWSSDSKILYLIKDEYHQSKTVQLFSIKGELWRYALETEKLELVLKPFPAHNYFLGRNSGVYFSVPDYAGNLQLKYFDGKGTQDIDRPSAKDISIEQFSSDNRDSIFFSISISDYEKVILPSKGIYRVKNYVGNLELKIGAKTLLALALGKGFKGLYYGDQMLRSILLPGDRYFLFNVNCENYGGQLLIDTFTGSYMTLPKDTRVYLALNTNTIKDFRINGSGIESVASSFVQNEAVR